MITSCPWCARHGCSELFENFVKLAALFGRHRLGAQLADSVFQSLKHRSVEVPVGSHIPVDCSIGDKRYSEIKAHIAGFKVFSTSDTSSIRDNRPLSATWRSGARSALATFI